MSPVRKKTLCGPDGCRVVLDKDEVHPGDPGAGTPAMVYYRGGSATLGCALGEGEIESGRDGFVMPIPRDVYEWLEEADLKADEFLGW